MSIDANVKAADQRVQALIDVDYDRKMIRERFKWEHARRSMAQRLRNDKREQKKWK